MLITLLIVLYLISTVCAWLSVRGWLKYNNYDGDLVAVFLVLMPVLNIVSCGVFLGVTAGERQLLKRVTNKFFKL